MAGVGPGGSARADVTSWFSVRPSPLDSGGCPRGDSCAGSLGQAGEPLRRGARCGSARVYLRRRRLGKDEPTTFQEIVVRPLSGREDGRGEDGVPFEIALASGDVVRVPASFDETALARLLDVLARTRACCGASRRACGCTLRPSPSTDAKAPIA